MDKQGNNRQVVTKNIYVVFLEVNMCNFYQVSRKKYVQY